MLLLVDVLLRVLAYGRYFWIRPNDHTAQTANRFDLVVTVVPMVLIFILWALGPSSSGGGGGGGWLFGGWVPLIDTDLSHLQDSRRVLLAIPLARIMSEVQPVRPLFYSLLSIVPNYWGIFGLFAVVLYAYAVISILLVSTDRLLSSEDNRQKINTFALITDYEIRQANFNSMFDAVVSLLQLFVGEAWDTVANAALSAKGNFLVLWFISYVVLMTLLFSNLLIGVIIDAFAVISELYTAQLDDSLHAPGDGENKNKNRKHTASHKTLSTTAFMTALTEHSINSTQGFVHVTLPDHENNTITVRRIGVRSVSANTMMRGNNRGSYGEGDGGRGGGSDGDRVARSPSRKRRTSTINFTRTVMAVMSDHGRHLTAALQIQRAYRARKEEHFGGTFGKARSASTYVATMANPMMKNPLMKAAYGGGATGRKVRHTPPRGGKAANRIVSPANDNGPSVRRSKHHPLARTNKGGNRVLL